MNYEFSAIEAKWHKYWEEHDTFHTDVWDFSKPKYYVLDMFPYPSGVGLHAGHPEGYTATDIMSRMKRMQGFNVLHPIVSFADTFPPGEGIAGTFVICNL